VKSVSEIMVFGEKGRCFLLIILFFQSPGSGPGVNRYYFSECSVASVAIFSKG